jgi:hypothetical protein
MNAPKIGDPIPCRSCEGDGEAWHPVEYDGSHIRECEACDGTGVVLDPWYRRAYLALSQEAGAVGWPKSFREDLTVHDRRQCEQMDPRTPFAWILRECGTHMVSVQPEPIDGVGNTGASLIRDCFAPGSWGDKARYYTWDGRTLREVADHKALATWVESMAQAIAYKRKRDRAESDGYIHT